MEFSPQNAIVRLCIQAMRQEAEGNDQAAKSSFQEAWNQAEYDFEKFMTAFFLARHPNNTNEEVQWLEKSLNYANKINDASVSSAFGLLHQKLALAYEELGEYALAKKHQLLSETKPDIPLESGPFFHGTKADLKSGDYLHPGGLSNYQQGLVMNHIYFTGMVNGAGLAASLAKGDGLERVYVVEPTGSFEDDPNVTNQKFPGNLTRSFRSLEPLLIIGEIKDWANQSSEEIKSWRKKLDENPGEIIN